jgi:hypothetical protein
MGNEGKCRKGRYWSMCDIDWRNVF